MASLIRSVSSHFVNSQRPDDVQLAQAIDRFQTEQHKLHRFKRELNKFLEAIVVFDDATFRFYEALRSLNNPTWEETTAMEQLIIEVRKTRNERLLALKNDLTTRIEQTTVKFDSINRRIDAQSATEQEYKKTTQRYQASLRNASSKSDRLRSEVDQLKSALRHRNEGLNRDLPNVQKDIRNDYKDITLDILDTEGKFYKKFYKTCSRFVKKSKKNMKARLNVEPENNDAAQQQVLNSESNSKNIKPQNQTASITKPPKFKILSSVKAIRPYEAINPDELSLFKGEIVSLIKYENLKDEEKDEGWEFAKKDNGDIGLIPMNFVERLSDHEDPFESDSQ